MNEFSRFTEDTLVQQTTADYLEQHLGWESIYAYNKENFGPNSLLGRDSDREVVLTRILREKLAELNPGLPDEACDDAVRQITTTLASQSLVATNRSRRPHSSLDGQVPDQVYFNGPSVVKAA